MRPIPRVTTRGYYDVASGRTIKKSPYYLYPRGSFEGLYGKKEMVVMVHGMRNDRAGAATKFAIAKRRLSAIGYCHPVIGYSYDSNVGYRMTEPQALRVGVMIAKKNGGNLAQFLVDFGRKSPNTKLRLMGHSLGSQVILSAVRQLARSPKNRGLVSSIHLFGASITADAPASDLLQKIVGQRVVNYYAPTDEVLGVAGGRGARRPLGLCGAAGRTIPKYVQRRVRPKNHRFKSYAAVLTSFP